MKHSMTAVVALVLGLGVAATVNAQTTNNPSTTPNPNAPAGTTATPPSDTANMPSTAPAQPQTTPSPTMAPQASESTRPTHMRTSRTHMSRNDVKQAQQQLKGAGLYHGKVDGIDGRGTKTAILRFQHRNGLRVTATLNRSTLNRLTGGSTAGVGSSMPSGSNRSMGHAHKMMPPPANAAGNAAGGNTGPNTQPNQQQ
jgi:peptidoglycan hydrolase-like protein with peptidoglycan-binding domain